MNFQAVTDAESAEVGRLLATSFHDDPGPVWWFPDPAERAERTPAFFAANARLGLALGDGVMTSAGEGVALYLPPGAQVTEADAAAAGIPEVLGSLGAEFTNKAGRFFAALGAMHGATMTEPHWNLFLVGVDPSAHGRGLGVTLVEEVNRRAVRDDVPVYLDTLTASNVGFYERRGYRVVAECDVPDSPIHVWGMRFN